MRNRQFQFAYCVAASLLCLVFGCQRDAGPLVSVGGHVTYKGLPLPGGTIVFVPDVSKGTAGKIAHGVISADGSYQLKTDAQDGASAGQYRITVLSLASAPSQPGQSLTFPRSNIPEKYRDPDLSELACEVKPLQSNVLDFNLN